MKLLVTLLSPLVILGATLSAQAQSYSIPWYAIAGGGGTSSNGAYSVSGTIGQAAAGVMSSGSYSLTGGFWGIIAAVQTPGAPLLSITATTGNQVILSWPASSVGFSLQSDSTLGNTNWATLNTNTYPVVVSGGSNTVSLPVSGNQYFRLQNP